MFKFQNLNSKDRNPDTLLETMLFDDEDEGENGGNGQEASSRSRSTSSVWSRVDLSSHKIFTPTEPKTITEEDEG